MIKLIIAELKKLKRTLALQMVVIAPLLVLSLGVVLVLRAEKPVNGEISPWESLSGNAMPLWHMLMVPLVITLQSALTGFTEHSNSMWKYLYTLPFDRWQFFMSKFTVNALLIAIAQFCFAFFQVLCGYLLLWLKPGLKFSSTIPWDIVLLPAAFGLSCSLLIVAIHTWVSLRFRSIVISLGTGIGAVVASMLIISSEYGKLFPWTIPGFIALLSIGRANIPGVEDPLAYATGYLYMMIPLAIVAALIGAMEFSRVDAQ